MDYETAAAEHRRLSIRRAVVKRRATTNYIVRSTAKRLAECADASVCEHLKMISPLDPAGREARDRTHLEKDLRKMLRSRAQRQHQHHPQPRLPAASSLEEKLEGQELARSDVPLPSDRVAQHEMSCVPAGPGKIRVRAADDAQVAELYGIGLLYDDGHASTPEVFDLNSIPHEDPVYSVRPARRGRNKGGKRAPARLGLTFTDLAAPEPVPLRVMYGVAGVGFDVETSQPPDLVTDAFSDYDCFSDSELDDEVPSQREVEEPASHLPAGTWVILN